MSTRYPEPQRTPLIPLTLIKHWTSEGKGAVDEGMLNKELEQSQ